MVSCNLILGFPVCVMNLSENEIKFLAILWAIQKKYFYSIKKKFEKFDLLLKKHSSIQTIRMGMDEGAINFLLSGRPFLAKVPKMRKFLSQGGHLTLERADNTNNTRWMDTCSSKGYLEAMVAHREGCRGVFRFDNFDKWLDKYRMTWCGYQGEQIAVLERAGVCYKYTRGKGLTSLGSWDTLDSTTMPVLINHFAGELSKDDTPAE